MFRFVPLAVLLVAAPVFAADPKPSDAEAELMAVVQKLGGKVELDTDLDADTRVAATFEKADDATLAALIKHPSLGSLDVRAAAKLTDKGFALLKELPNLQRLHLSGCTVEATEAAAIGTLRPLTVLVLGGCKLTDAEVAKFAKLKNLKTLDLMDTPVTDKSIDTVLLFAKLEELNLSGTRVTDAGAKRLLAVESLKLVQLNNTKVTDGAIATMEESLKSSKRGLKILR